LEEIGNISEKVTYQKGRLLLLIVERERNLVQIETLGFAGVSHGADENVDMFSDTSSLASHASRSSQLSKSSKSAGSRASRASHKSKKKTERKRQMAKEGSPFEFESLLNSMVQIVTRVNYLKGDISEFLKIFVYFGEEEKGRILQKEFFKINIEIAKAIDECFISQEGFNNYKARLIAVNPDATLEKFIEKPVLANTFWKIDMLDN